MSGRIEKPSGSPQDSSIYRIPQASQGKQDKQPSAQPEARSAYTFRDSRHVVRGGAAAVSFELEVEEENAEHIELLGFKQGDHLRLDGMGSIHGTAFIQKLTSDLLTVQFKLNVPESARRAAAIVFERLSQQPYLLDDQGQVHLTGRVIKDGKGGYSYALIDHHHQDRRLMAEHLDLRIDNFSARNIEHQVLTFIVASGNNLTFAIEQEPKQDPKGKLKLSVAPGMGEFEVTRHANP